MQQQNAPVFEVTQLRERFSLWGTVGVQYTMVGAPLTIGSYMSFSLGVCGSPLFIYTYIVCSVFQMGTFRDALPFWEL